MGHLAKACRGMWDGLKRYPVTIAIRGTAIAFFAGIAFLSNKIAIVEGAAVIMVIVSYLIIKVYEFFGCEMSGRAATWAISYNVFEVVWYILSWPAEVPDRET